METDHLLCSVVHTAGIAERVMLWPLSPGSVLLSAIAPIQGEEVWSVHVGCGQVGGKGGLGLDR